MKTPVLLTLVFLITGLPSMAQGNFPSVEDCRKRLVSDLVFYYVEKPHLDKNNRTASYPLNSQNIAANSNLNNSFWTNTNNSGMQEFLKTLLQPAANDRDAMALQYYAANILRINPKKRVIIFIFNDHNNQTLTTNRIDNSWGHSGTKVGPSGAFDPYGTQRCPKCTGDISLGIADFHPKTPQARGGTFLHELVHTQDNVSGSPNYLGDFSGSMDKNHYEHELLANYHLAYSEGIGYGFSYLYDRENDLFDWLESNKEMIYEVIPAGDCTRMPSNACLDQYLSTQQIMPFDTVRKTQNDHPSLPRRYLEKHYHIRDLPPEVLMHNETVLAFIFYTYAKFIGMKRLVRSVRGASERTLNSVGFPYVFERMVYYANGYSNQNKPPGERTYGQFLPVALMDFFTGFQLTDKQALNKCLGQMNLSRFEVNIDDYWDAGHRQKILQIHGRYNNRFGPIAVGMQQLEDIAAYFNVITP